jgi:hypothetical protein
LSAFDLIDHLVDRGIEIVVVGDKLRWRAPDGTMTDDDIAILREHKQAIVAAHRPTHPTPAEFDGWLDEQIEIARRRDAFEERAAILEFDAGLSRPEAERQAAADTNLEGDNQ